MLVKIQNLPNTKSYSRVKAMAVHPKLSLVAIAICDIKFYLRLHPFSLTEPDFKDEQPLAKDFFRMKDAVHERMCEQTKIVEWSSTGSLLFQITTKGIKILSLQSQSSILKLNYSLRNIDYLEDASEVVCFSKSSRDSHIFYGTLDSKLVKYNLARKFRVSKPLPSKATTLKTDPLDKWLLLLSLDNILSVYSFSNLELKRSVPLGLDLSAQSLSPITRVEVSIGISPDLKSVIVPNIEKSPMGVAFGLSPQNNFEISHMIGISTAEISCVEFFPFVCIDNKKSHSVIELSQSQSSVSSKDPLSQ